MWDFDAIQRDGKLCPRCNEVTRYWYPYQTGWCGACISARARQLRAQPPERIDGCAACGAGRRKYDRLLDGDGALVAWVCRSCRLLVLKLGLDELHAARDRELAHDGDWWLWIETWLDPDDGLDTGTATPWWKLAEAGHYHVDLGAGVERADVLPCTMKIHSQRCVPIRRQLVGLCRLLDATPPPTEAGGDVTSCGGADSS